MRNIAILAAASTIVVVSLFPAHSQTARRWTGSPYKNVPCSACADQPTFDGVSFCNQTCCRAPRGAICARGGGVKYKKNKKK